jgi:hypothetical protein
VSHVAAATTPCCSYSRVLDAFGYQNAYFLLAGAYCSVGLQPWRFCSWSGVKGPTPVLVRGPPQVQRWQPQQSKQQSNCDRRFLLGRAP